MSATIPHLALPFRIVAGAAVVNEQDSLEEISACVEAIVRCPRGHRLELPEFGVDDQTFRQGGADPRQVKAAVDRWEPRARASAIGDPSALRDALSRVTVETHAGGSGQ